MANRYEEAFSGLLDLVRGGKEFHEKYHKNICESIGAIINLGDSSYAEYSSMVETNELRVASTIENLAVSLFTDNSNPQFLSTRYRSNMKSCLLKNRRKRVLFRLFLLLMG